jgi:hypothetical protein
MAFEDLSDRLKLVAGSSLAICRNNYGVTGLRREEPIDDGIGWKPTFYLRPSRVLIVAVEVSDFIFPQILQIAADDISQYNHPIAIYQACSLDVYQKDKDLKRVNMLRDRGIVRSHSYASATIGTKYSNKSFRVRIKNPYAAPQGGV